jgi:hypothetical protein
MKTGGGDPALRRAEVLGLPWLLVRDNRPSSARGEEKTAAVVVCDRRFFALYPLSYTARSSRGGIRTRDLALHKR